MAVAASCFDVFIFAGQTLKYHSEIFEGKLVDREIQIGVLFLLQKIVNQVVKSFALQLAGLLATHCQQLFDA